jgi:hypothetical protein
MGTSPPRVFISYSHDSTLHKDLVLSFAKRLRKDGIDAQIDQYVKGRPPGGWPRWMLDKLDWAEFVLLICTETYYRRFRGHEELGTGKGVDWEGQLITLELYQAKSRKTKFVPVIFVSQDKEFIPEPLRDHPYRLDSEDSYLELYSFLTGQADVSLPKIGPTKELPRKNPGPLIFEDPSKSTAPVTIKDSPQVFLSKLPTTAGTLFGREKELALLDKVWDDSLIHVVMVAAWGGAGKTALVNHWLNRLEQQRYRRAERVYGWSFYIQGSTPDRQSSADEFLAHALQWFGDPDPAQGVPWDKGVRLAGLIRKHRTLLILDGAEPLQNTSGELHGRIKDEGLHALLKELARAG